MLSKADTNTEKNKFTSRMSDKYNLSEDVINYKEIS